MSRLQAETHVFDCLPSVVAENFISERFGVISERSTFQVRSCWMSRSGAETSVFDSLRSVVTENVILERFGVISERSTFHVSFAGSVAFEPKRAFSTASDLK